MTLLAVDFVLQICREKMRVEEVNLKVVNWP